MELAVLNVDRHDWAIESALLDGEGDMKDGQNQARGLLWRISAFSVVVAMVISYGAQLLVEALASDGTQLSLALTLLKEIIVFAGVLALLKFRFRGYLNFDGLTSAEVLLEAKSLLKVVGVCQLLLSSAIYFSGMGTFVEAVVNGAIGLMLLSTAWTSSRHFAVYAALLYSVFILSYNLIETGIMFISAFLLLCLIHLNLVRRMYVSLRRENVA